MEKWVFDTEVFKNFYLLVAQNLESGEIRKFSYYDNPKEIFKKHDTTALIEFLNSVELLTGYNNRSYDNLVLIKFLEGGSTREAKAYSDSLIAQKERNPFTRPLCEKLSEIPGFTGDFIDIDLMSMLMLRTGLKVLECQLNLPRIDESPIPFDATLQHEQIQGVTDYCIADVAATAKIWGLKKTQDAIKIRESLHSEFPKMDFRSLISYGETTLISSILPAAAKDEFGISRTQSFRSPADETTYYGKDFLDAKSFQFESPILQALLAEALEFPHTEKRFSRKIEFAGMEITYAQGGLHGVSKSEEHLFESSAEKIIIDIDVASFYPALIYKYEVAPEYWRESFLAIYEKIRQSRLEAKASGDKSKANAYKLILNGTYGKFKSPNSVLYTKVGTFRVAMNGEFWLLKLIENLSKIEGIEFIQANTDGITCRIDRNTLSEFREICREWSRESIFDLEETEFSKIYMVDVNNYVAIGTDGKVKCKGRFHPTQFGASGCKVPNVCRIAAANFIISGIPLEETIRKHENLHDFFLYGKRSTLFMNGVELPNRVFRGYFSTTGGTLSSRSGKREAIEFEGISLVDIFEGTLKDVDYTRYIYESQKIVSGADEKTTKKLKPSKKFWDGVPLSELIEKSSEEMNDGLNELYGKFGDVSCKVSDPGKRALLPISMPLPGRFNVQIQVPAGWIVLDLDVPEKVPFDVEPSLVCTYHSKDVSEVIEKKEKGHVWYRDSDGGHYGKVSLEIDGKTAAELFGEGSWITVPPSVSTKKTHEPYGWLDSGNVVEIPDKILSSFPPFAKPKEDDEEEKPKEVSPWMPISLETINDAFGTTIEEGQNFCPHHEEEKPSCTYYPEQGKFYCYSCTKPVNMAEYISLVTKTPISSVIERLDSIMLERLQIGRHVAVSCRSEFYEDMRKEILAGGNISFTGATGLGKTYAIAEFIASEDCGPCICLFDTKAQMRRFEKIIRGFKPDLVIEKYESNSGNEDITEKSTETKTRVIFMQSAYAFERWHTGDIYSHVSLFKGRRVFIDESHNFFARCEIQEQLTHCYFGKAGKRMDKCPKHIKFMKASDDCACCHSANRLPPNTPKDFIFEIPQNIGTREFKVELPADWMDFSTYIGIPDTKLCVKILKSIYLFKEGLTGEYTPDVNGYYRHLNFIQANTIGRQLRVEIPNESMNPAHTCLPCRCITFWGLSTLPFKALATAKQTIYITATPSASMDKAFPRDTKRVDYKIAEPVKFPVTFCQIPQRITDGKLVRLFSEIPGPKAVIVHPRITDSQRLAESMSQHLIDKKITYYRSKFWGSEESDEASDIRILYAGAPILTGFDMVDRNVMIIDLGIYPPISAAGLIDDEDTKESILEKIILDMKIKVLQMFGRLYRGDVRPLIFILHNAGKLPVILPDEKISETNIVSPQSIMSRKRGKEMETLAQNIQRVIRGEEMIDYEFEVEESLEKETRDMSKKERKLTKDARAEVKAEAKAEGIRQIVYDMLQAGREWREVSRKIHFERLEKELQDELLEIFNMV
jgi:hypothetical protein